MNNTDQLQDCLAQLEDIATTTESISSENEERASSISLLLDHAKETQNKIKVLDEVLIEIANMSSNLHLLSINTAIESAHTDAPAVGVIANEMRKMSDTYIEYRKTLQKLSDDIESNVDELVDRLDKATEGVLDTSASLQELTACTEELVATLETISNN